MMMSIISTSEKRVRHEVDLSYVASTRICVTSKGKADGHMRTSDDSSMRGVDCDYCLMEDIT